MTNFNHRLELAVKDCMQSHSLKKLFQCWYSFTASTSEDLKKREEIADLAHIFEQEENSKSLF